MKLYPFLDQGLPGQVRRMGLAGDDELHRALRIGQQTKQPLLDRAAAGSVSCRSRSGAQNLASRRWDRTGASHRRPSRAARLRQPVAGTIVRERIQRATCWRQCEIARAWHRRLGECPAPEFSVVPSQRSLPQASVHRSSAGAESQVGMWTPLVTWPTGTSSSGQRGNSGSKEVPAHLPMQAAHAIDRSAARGLPDRPC